MAGDQRIDVGARIRELVQVGFQGALEDVAAFSQLLDLACNEPVNACAALRQLLEVVLQGLGQARAADRELLDMACEQAVDAGEIGFQRLGEGLAAPVQPLQLFGDHAFDDLPALLQLFDVAFQHMRHRIASIGEFLDLAFHQIVDRRQVGLEGARKDVAAFRELLDLGGDDAVDVCTRLGQLGEVGFQRPRQDVSSLGQFADMPGDHFVNVHTGL